MEQEEKGEGVGWGEVEGEVFTKDIEIAYSSFLAVHTNRRIDRDSPDLDESIESKTVLSKFVGG
jgi:hypothetical protein